MPNRSDFRTVSLALRVAVLLCVGYGCHALAVDSPEFRGPNRNGIFQEKNLMKSWPEAGPKMLWSVEGLGQGYASVSIADGRLYTTGKQGDQGYAFAYDLKGKQLWSSAYGREHHGSGYPGTRTTPTVHGDKLFLVSSIGEVVALNTADGKVAWRVDMLERFGGGANRESLYPRFGIAESPLVVDNKVICTPGGKEAVMAALDPKTGKTLWKTKSIGDISGYCTPRLYQEGGRRMIVTMTSGSMIAVDPANGSLIWRQDYPATYNIHAVSPVWQGPYIYVSDGYGQGGACFKMADNGKSVKQVWDEKTLDIHHGGTVLVNDYIYGASNSKNLICLKLNDGGVASSIRRFGKGSLIHADGLLIGYTERGKVKLVDPNPNDMKVISEFELELGSGQHWAHPVVSDGVLYIRRGKAMAAFDIRAK